MSAKVQYGRRDDDDDDDDSDDDRRNGLFGGMLLPHNKKNKRGSAGGGVGGIIQNLGASMNFSTRGDDVARNDNNDDNNDDGTGVASKAKKALNKLGDSLRFSIHRTERNKGDDDDDDSSSGDDSSNNDSDDSDDDSQDEMDTSVAKRAAKKIRQVTGKLTQALRVGGRKDDDSDSDEEEDPLEDNRANTSRGILPRLNLGRKEMKSDLSQGSHGSASSGTDQLRSRERERETTAKKMPNLFRRSTSEVPSTTARMASPKKNFSRSATVEPHLTESRLNAAKAAAKVLAAEQFVEPAEAVWSMNVTEKMLEQATNDGVFVPPFNKPK